jgi:hypothetical protein
VFGDDKKMEIFLTNEGEFTSNEIDWDGLNEILKVEYLT